MAREAGAKKVYFASCSPPIRFDTFLSLSLYLFFFLYLFMNFCFKKRHPNVYGIDMPSADELVAFSRSEEEIAKELGADAVIYLVLFHSIFSFSLFVLLFF